MTWHFAIGCVIGGAAAVLVLSAGRLWKYFVALWKVVASVQPRRRSAGTGAPKQLAVKSQTVGPEAAAGNNDRLGGES